MDWIVSDDTVVRPDLLVICGDVPERHLETSPDLIAEVLSDSTRQKDLTFKRQLYESQGVSTYLIVDPSSRQIEMLRLTDGKYQSAASNGRLVIELCDGCKLEIRPATLFA